MDIESLLNNKEASADADQILVRRKSSNDSPVSSQPSTSRATEPELIEAVKPANTPLSHPSLPQQASDVRQMTARANAVNLPYYTQDGGQWLAQPAEGDLQFHAAADPALAVEEDYENTSQSELQGDSGLEKNLPCSTCRKPFSRRSDLVRHERIHSGARPHTCLVPGCGKSFIQRSALTVHERVHTGEKPHRCGECSKPFSDSSSLARHRRIHTGHRPYVCEFPGCNKTFTRRTTLTRHQHHHNNNNNNNKNSNSNAEGESRVPPDGQVHLSEAQTSSPENPITSSSKNRKRTRGLGKKETNRQQHLQTAAGQPHYEHTFHDSPHAPVHHLSGLQYQRGHEISHPEGQQTSFNMRTRSQVEHDEEDMRYTENAVHYNVATQERVFPPQGANLYPPIGRYHHADQIYHQHAIPTRVREAQYPGAPYEWAPDIDRQY